MKKILTLVACLSLVASLAVGGSIAYLQDQKSTVNVMTLGKVDITIHEYERDTDDNGTYKIKDIDGKPSYVLKPFVSGSKQLVPIVGDPNEPEDSPAYAGWDTTATVRMSQVNSYGGMSVFAGKNAIDKFVTVENTGKSPAYVRTFVAFEIGSADPELIQSSYHDTWTKTELGVMEIGGINYKVREYVYAGAKNDDGTWLRHDNGVLPAGETSYPPLAQVYLKSAATNEDVEKIDGNKDGAYNVLVLSQAVQADGFDSAESAFKAAFPKGENNVNVAGWFTNDVEKPTIVNTAAELQKALDEDKNEIIFGANITGDVTVTEKNNVKVTINGANKTFAGTITVNGGTKHHEGNSLTIKNIIFDGDKLNYDAYIRLGGNNNIRYTDNVTVADCTFKAATYTNDKNETSDAACVKSYTGGDWNTTITGCTAEEGTHSLCQFTNVEKNLVINDCKVYSKNGANLNNTPSLKMDGCTFDVKGYAVRFGVNGSVNAEQKSFEITNSKLSSACAESGDAVIIIRDNAKNAKLDLTGTTLTGTPDILGATEQTIISGK